jgi:hypothetical protein
MYMEEREAIARKRMKGGDYLSFEPLFGWWPDINRSMATHLASYTYTWSP